jgi:hypothetical protein
MHPLIITILALGAMFTLHTLYYRSPAESSYQCQHQRNALACENANDFCAWCPHTSVCVEWDMCTNRTYPDGRALHCASPHSWIVFHPQRHRRYLCNPYESRVAVALYYIVTACVLAVIAFCLFGMAMTYCCRRGDSTPQQHYQRVADA